jgi:HEAT repeat-containing protein 5
MSQAPELKNKLESAYKSSQEQAANKQKLSDDMETRTATAAVQSQQQQQPTIKLKTDFSNFS